MGSHSDLRRRDFPSDFIFGTATSAFQVEGAICDGKRGLSIWDTFTEIPGKVRDKSNAAIACDYYNRYKDDINLMAELGFNAYRFSISWSRIMLDDLTGVVNPDGILFYNNVINFLIEKGITPFATLYHWDLPQVLHDTIGGWLRPEIAKYFAVYAETCFQAFGDRVKHWITLNEPLRFATLGYELGVHAPGRSSSSMPCLDGEAYVVGHNALLAHAAAVDVYKRKFKDKQGGIIGIAVDSEWAEPLTSSTEDKEAAQRHLEFSLSWFLDPIFFGKYPKSMCENVGDRLPRFTEEQARMVQGSTDFVGINHYFSGYVTAKNGQESMSPDSKDASAAGPLSDALLQSHNHAKLGKASGDVRGWFSDVNTRISFERDGKLIGDKGASPWMYIVPWGFGKLLKWITERYNRPPIFVTENGIDDDNDPAVSKIDFLHDTKRVAYIQDYLFYVAQSIREGADVRGYFAWSYLDNFEWAFGYTSRFGIVFVDFEDGLKRYPKDSAVWFQQFLKDGVNHSLDASI